MKFKFLAIVILLLFAIGAAAQSTATKAVMTSAGTAVSSPKKAAPKTTSDKEEFTKTWSVIASFNTTFDSNLEHDVTPVRAAGFAPSVVAGYQLRSKRHRVRFIYGLSASRYTRSTDRNRVGQYFGASYRFSLGRWSWETEGEAILKGTNDDRETNDQFIATQKLGYRFDGKTRANVYFAYRLKRYIPVDAARNSVNPIYGFKFSRQFGKKADWDIGYRYEENRAQNSRQSYIRSTYNTAIKYQLTKKELLETGFSFKPRLYARTLRVGAFRFPRRDRKYSWDASWNHLISDRIAFELGYNFEKQTSNDADKRYKDHQISFSILYHWGNGESIMP